MEIEFREKHLDYLAAALRPRTRLLVSEGTIRSSKTVMAIQAFFYRTYRSEGFLHLIGGRDFDTINNNLLENAEGLLSQFPGRCVLKKDRIGGYYVEMRTGKGIKKILLAGYGDRSKWKKILGSSVENMLIDEVNIADEQFVDECFARQTSFAHPLTLWTTNGDMPELWVYGKYINRCKILGEAPASIRAEMDRVAKVPGWYYTHWTMRDNPVMTPEKIAAAEALYPAGSYYYTIKILGERGSPGELIYLDYLDLDRQVRPQDPARLRSFGVGVDVGAGRARNATVLAGFEPGFAGAAVMDLDLYRQVGYGEKKERLKADIRRWLGMGYNIEYVAVDSAEQNFIVDLKSEFLREGLPPVIASYKATIKERIDLVILLLAAGKLSFAPAARKVFEAFRQARWSEGKIGQEREDLNQWPNDVMDAAEYALTPHMKGLLRAAKETGNG